MRFLARMLGSQPNASQSLINLENSEVRADLAWRLTEPAPQVPLRATSERFGYPRSSYTVMRLMSVFALAMLAIILIVVIRDPVQMGSPQDFGAAMLAFGGGGLFFAYSGWVAVTEIEVTDQRLGVWRHGRQRKQIRWTEVRSVSHSHSGVVVRGVHATIRFSYLIESYGRLKNLVLTRAPATTG